MVGVVLVEARLHLLGQQRERVGVDARAALLQDDVALGAHLILQQPEVHHPVRLQAHDGLEVLLGDALIVGGGVVGRGRIVAAAEAGDDLRELARLDLAGRLEHQVLEEVGDSRGAPRVVGGAAAIPDHVRDDRHAVIGDDHDLHAVGKVEGADLELRAACVRGEDNGRHREPGDEAAFENTYELSLHTACTPAARRGAAPNYGIIYLNLDTRSARSRMTRALSVSAVPAGSPLNLIVGLDQIG